MERRSALQLIAGGVIAGQLEAAQQHHLVTVAGGPGDYKLQFFTPEQNKTIDTLANLIIPADEQSAGAHDAKVSLFIDLMVASSAQEIKNEWLAGIRAVEREAETRYHAAFANCTAHQARGATRGHGGTGDPPFDRPWALFRPLEVSYR